MNDRGRNLVAVGVGLRLTLVSIWSLYESNSISKLLGLSRAVVERSYEYLSIGDKLGS
jgi:hypothetical protein